MRSVSGPFAGMSVWLWTYVVTRALPSMFTTMTWGVYVFFASCLVCASVYAYFFIHETKGLRIDQMDRLFGFERERQLSSAPESKSEVDSLRKQAEVVEVDRKEVA